MDNWNYPPGSDTADAPWNRVACECDLDEREEESLEPDEHFTYCPLSLGSVL